MLPEASNRNITLGFTVALDVFAIGAFAMSVTAALAVIMAKPIPRTSANLVWIKLIGEGRFMIAPEYVRNLVD
jgi:hypothetical protein